MSSEHIISRNNAIIEGFIKEYSENGIPIPVSFRDLMPEIKNIDRSTHLIHTYPAKLLVHIPYLFLNNSILSKSNDMVLDPFCGSGTVLLEGILAGRKTLGADANPLARLIAQVKTKYIPNEILYGYLDTINKKIKNINRAPLPEVVNLDYWFPKKTQIQLAKLLHAINTIDDDDVKNFMLVGFSNCVKKVSLADPRISVPVKLNPDRYEINSTQWGTIKEKIEKLTKQNVYAKFNQIISENISKVEKLNQVKRISSSIISIDAQRLTKSLQSNALLKNESVQLIITSPPYAGAQKYIRSSSLNLGWTQLASVKDLSILDSKNIGRENFKNRDINIRPTGINSADELIKKINEINPSRANIVCVYIDEMKIALKEMVRVLKKDGYLVLIVGNNKVCGFEFNIQEYFTEYLISEKLQLQFKLIDDIRSYGLMTKRNKTADIISREWILVFKKMR